MRRHFWLEITFVSFVVVGRIFVNNILPNIRCRPTHENPLSLDHYITNFQSSQFHFPLYFSDDYGQMTDTAVVRFEIVDTDVTKPDFVASSDFNLGQKQARVMV
jgi:hypothetical protein